MKNNSIATFSANTVEVIKDDRVISKTFNTTTKIGRKKWLESLLSTDNLRFSTIKAGDGTSGSTEEDTELENETGSAEVKYDISSVEETTAEIYATFSVAGEIVMNELGLYVSDETNETIIAKTSLPSTVTKADGEAISIKWTVNLNQG